MGPKSENVKISSEGGKHIFKNLETPVRKGTHSRSHAIAFDELSGAEEQDSEEAKVRRAPSLARGSISPPLYKLLDGLGRGSPRSR